MGVARLLGFTALIAAEWVRGIGLVAAGALTYGLLGGVMPAPGGFDQPVAIAAFLTIALGAVDLLLAALFAATALRLGPGLDPATQMGPLTHARRLEDMERFVADHGRALVAGA
jgi:hypothetical protein